MPIRPILLTLFLVVVAIITTTPVAAHQSQAGWTMQSAVVVTVDGDHGASAGGRPFTITVPGETEPWLRGETDIRGRVVFMPDRDGSWVVRVFGQDGHGAEVIVDLGSPDHTAATDHHDHAGHQHDATATDHETDAHVHDPGSAAISSKVWRTIGGIGVILVVFAVVDLIVRRRR